MGKMELSMYKFFSLEYLSLEIVNTTVEILLKCPIKLI